MIVYPDVQRKAHSVIDSTIGRSRLPELSDRATAPYLEALLYEILRWQPVAPLGGFPSTTIEFDKEFETNFYLRCRSRIHK
jgi:cytochrome P450